MFYAALALSIVCNGGSLVLLKWYARDRELGSGSDGEARGVQQLLDKRVLLSVALFGVAGVTWLMALKGLDLSLAYPSMSTIYVATALVGRYFFGEYISVRRGFGIAMVVVGVAIMHGL